MCWQHIQEISQNLEWPKEELNTINQEHLGLTLLFLYSHYEAIQRYVKYVLKGRKAEVVVSVSALFWCRSVPASN